MSGLFLELLSSARSFDSEPNDTMGFVTAKPLQMADTEPTTTRFKRMSPFAQLEIGMYLLY
jgi:hypothetical protein